MAFFDKLKEMANKTINQVTKAVDPSAKEQERLEKEKALRIFPVTPFFII